MKSINSEDSLAKSADIVSANLGRLKELFPEAWREGKLDFEVLQQLLGAVVDKSDEKYGLNWHGKRRARQVALTPSAGTLRPCHQDSVDWDTTKNLMIEGDNLEVLKLLQKSYAGKVKLIFIDPPYNTGKDFVYTDDYKDNIQNYLKVTGQLGSDGGRLSTNFESSGRYHADWLTMMYPRLVLSHFLLRKDGLFVATISDAEVHNLRSILDQIFGDDNFIGNVVWNSTKSVTNTALISVSHTHCLVYAKSKAFFVENRTLFRLPEDGEGFANPDNDPRGPWKADPFQVGGERPNQMYEVVNPNTGEVYRPAPGCCWKNDLVTFTELMAQGRIVFGATGEAGPQRKRFLSEAEERGKVAKTLWDDLDTTTNATRDLKRLMGESVFDSPKPVDLVSRFIQLCTAGANDEVVLDFFAGSGTTGHATMAQNIADAGSRRFVLVQLPVKLSTEEPETKAAANFCVSSGLSPTIAELTKQRLSRASKLLKAENPLFAGDLGFRVFKLDSTNIREWDPDRTKIAESLEANVEHLKTDRTEQDILFELLLKLGLDLCVPIETRNVKGREVHSIGAGALMACLSTSIPADDVEDLAQGILSWHKELGTAGESMVVFRDSAFADDIAKTNLTSILNQGGLTNVRSL